MGDVRWINERAKRNAIQKVDRYHKPWKRDRTQLWIGLTLIGAVVLAVVAMVTL